MDHRDEPPRKYKTYGGSRAVRLPDFDYVGEVDIHVVICTESGQPFGSDTLAKEVCRSIEITSEKLQYRLYGYCLMPDHLHVLLSPAHSGKPLRNWLQTFKSYTAHWAKRNLGIPTLWQRSCHDHVCRTGETAEHVLRYILNNPIRAGLVKCAEDWIWSRSFIEA